MLNKIASNILDGLLMFCLGAAAVLVIFALVAVVDLIYHVPWVLLVIVGILIFLWALGTVANKVFK